MSDEFKEYKDSFYEWNERVKKELEKANSRMKALKKSMVNVDYSILKIKRDLDEFAKLTESKINNKITKKGGKSNE